ncbi:HD domain-containing protein [Janibacter sp. GS2]|uniref:HD domain-containing protein n=1 Tax=Janibacter sp. GS2 TaxID=3442646 RepID=UPI003EB9D2A0
MDTLRSRWRADVAALCAAPDRDRVAAEGTDLLDRWLEDHRAYHDAVHLAEVLAALDELSEGGDLPARDRHLAGLVAWYHDAVYDAGVAAGVNEEASAALAQQRLPLLGLPEEVVAEVVRLVRESATHEMTTRDPATLAFHDADLWILASPTERFDAYCHQVRLEYRMVPRADFARGRTAVLTPFATRERLYLTEHAHAHWTQRARVNLARELDRLAGHG